MSWELGPRNGGCPCVKRGDPALGNHALAALLLQEEHPLLRSHHGMVVFAVEPAQVSHPMGAEIGRGLLFNTHIAQWALPTNLNVTTALDKVV